MNVTANNKARLGRGLDALLGPVAEAAGPASRVPIEKVRENPFQPRKAFDADELASLRDSIREYGVLQPVVVRSDQQGYQLIAGERRLRAAREAGLTEIPVTVVDFTDQQVNEAALVENIQRSDLNAIEKAQGFKDYLERFDMTHERLAERIGIDRSSITNLLGLLSLPAEVQAWVRTGQISLGHAKVLKGLQDPPRQTSLAKDVIARSLSVHALEVLIKEQNAVTQPAARAPRSAAEKTAHVAGLEDELRQKLGVRVTIRLQSKEKGKIVLEFATNDDFERILERLRI